MTRAKRGDLVELAWKQIYNGCSDCFTESAYTGPARTRLLLTAVPAVAVEVMSLIDEGMSPSVSGTLDFMLRSSSATSLNVTYIKSIFKDPSRPQITADSAQDHPGQNSVAASQKATPPELAPSPMNRRLISV
ncbi:hypothetical protein HPB52_004148 [Rhipicephalus sanguineus]|uniref:Uncharacterized protein n=1 Tax=Rhipicephalus sanguineus TaxID=34632 RepID=A0A9D4QG77_RHISA|nr:hypothetical protein HPB52_004148 [Rhipicephalus sanguineus]